MKNELKQLGLSNNEIKVYTALLDVGENTVGPIANKLKIHRQLIYDALASLESKHMVVKTTKVNRSYFRVSNPDNILENVKRKERIALGIIPEIEKMMNWQKKGQEIKIYEGSKAYRELTLENYNKMSTGSETYVMFGIGKKFVDMMNVDNGLKRLDRIEKEKNIKTKMIFSETWREDVEKDIDSKREYRYIKVENESPVTIQVWPNSVSLISSGSDIFVIEIINEDFRKAYLNYFNIFWKIGKK